VSAGNSDGTCTDCGEPIWWSGSDGNQRLVTQDGNRWCFGPNRSRIGMKRWHALPGMAQYIVPSPLGQVCHCLDRRDRHIHLIVDPPPEGATSDRDALDSIARVLRDHAGTGHLEVIATLVQDTGRATRNRDLL
jgi:hypothetical protein